MTDSVRWPIVILALLLVLGLVLFARGGDGEQRGQTLPTPFGSATVPWFGEAV